MKLFGAKKEEAAQVKKPDRAGREALEALNKLKEDMQKKPFEEVSEKFFSIVKRFLSDYFHIKHEFTHDEFCGEIKRKRGVDDAVKEHVTSFSEEISEIKYKYDKISAEKLHEIMHDFSELVLFLSDKKKHESVYEQTRRLREYVKFALDKGRSKDQIEQALIEAGWPAVVVERELENLK